MGRRSAERRVIFEQLSEPVTHEEQQRVLAGDMEEVDDMLGVRRIAASNGVMIENWAGLDGDEGITSWYDIDWEQLYTSRLAGVQWWCSCDGGGWCGSPCSHVAAILYLIYFGRHERH